MIKTVQMQRFNPDVLTKARKMIDTTLEGVNTVNSQGEPRSRVSIYWQSGQIKIHTTGPAAADSNTLSAIVDKVNEAKAGK